MSFGREFRDFAIKGNAVDLAVGVIIGAAFGKIVDSIINDLIMPVVGRLFGGLDFSNLFVPLAAVPEGTAKTLVGVREAGVPVFAYGSFLSVAVNFAVLAWIIFLMVRAMNAARRKPAAVAPVPSAPPEDIVLLREIRDSLRFGR